MKKTGVSKSALLALAMLVMALGGRTDLFADWKIVSADEKSELKIGFLVQLQGESIRSADEKLTATDIYFRRARLIFGGRLDERLSFFLDTDSPNLGKGDGAGKKNDAQIFIQDFFLTYKVRDELMFDGGLFLVPNSYSTLQSATNPMGIDLGAFSYQASAPTGSRVGRDYGLQARGYLRNKHLEYRASVFQGARGSNDSMPLRYSGRLAYWPLDTFTGIYYFGTGFGQKKIVSLGTSMDHQQDYNSVALDFFADLPVAGRDAITFQVDWIRYNGGRTFLQLPRQDGWFVEAGYYIRKVKLTPFFQYNGLQVDRDQRPNENRYQGGVAFWPKGHTFNLKFSVAQQRKDGLENRTQYQFSCQFFQF